MGAILEPGKNCWRRVRAGRLAFLVDGQAYFHALDQALRKARHSVLVTGWDMDSRATLRRGSADQNRPGDPENPEQWGPRLGRFLNALCRDNPQLHVHVLVWDFSMLFALERESMPRFKMELSTHPRVHFYMDGEHPMGASHHQKIVVVDDRVAFCGGLDLTKRRWDTPDHLPDDPRRTDPDGEAYGPFHDAMVAVDGEAARCLGDLVRSRWLQATGRELEPPEAGQGGEDPWPEDLTPHLEDVEVAVARTCPGYKDRAEVREVEALFVDAIASAQRLIYVENQYFTSDVIGEALARRLREEDGPEIVLVLPREIAGWLEDGTMGSLRSVILKRLREADEHGRLVAYAPVAEDGGSVMVHAKIMVVDDRLVRVGSANLSSRSMGLDTECDLAVEAPEEGEGAVAEAIDDFRNRLVAEHLGREPGEVAAAVREHGSLLAAVKALRGEQGRTLVEVDDEPAEWVEEVLPDAQLIDPKRPARMERMIDELVDGHDASRRSTGWIKVALAAIVLATLAAIWRFTPLGEQVDVDAVVSWVATVRYTAWAPAWILGAYVVGGLVAFPVTVLIAATAVVFDPLWAFGYALVGSMVSAAVGFVVGHLLGRGFVRRVGGGRLERLSRRLATQGMLAVALVRMVPIAPYTVINLASGASSIRFRSYMAGTLLGMGPGITVITLFTGQLKDAILDPGPLNVALLVGASLLLAAGLWFLKRRVGRKVKAKGLADNGTGAA